MNPALSLEELVERYPTYDSALKEVQRLLDATETNKGNSQFPVKQGERTEALMRLIRGLQGQRHQFSTDCAKIEQEIAALETDLMQHAAENQRLRDALRVALPMAKAWAYDHQVGDNVGKVAWAEAILADANEPSNEALKPAAGVLVPPGTVDDPDAPINSWCSIHGKTFRCPLCAPPVDPLTDQPLKVEDIDGRLVISIGRDTLAHAIRIGMENTSSEWTVGDAAGLLHSVVDVLKDEAEDGTTRVHQLLDEAASYALDYGFEGFTEISQNHSEDS